MPKLIADGSHYIQKSNQDYWLRLNGVWVRMGNIRDEGTGGLVTVPPIVSQGLDLNVTNLDRWRYVPDASGFQDGMGFDTTIAALERIRYVAGVGESVGFAISPLTVNRVRQLSAAFNMGFINSAQLQRAVMFQAAISLGFSIPNVDLNAAVEVDFVVPMTVGFTAAAALTRAKMLSATMGVGFDEAATIAKVTQLSAAMGLGFGTAATVDASASFVVPVTLGFSAAVNLTKSRMLSAAFTIGFAQSVGLALDPTPLSIGYTMSAPTLLRIKPISAAFSFGYDMAALVSGFFGTLYIPTNTAFSSSSTPSAVDTTFTFTSGGALESHLYDGNPSTPAADSRGVRSDTHAAYDFGSDKLIIGVNIVTAPANGFTDNVTFKIQYSDTGLTTGWTDTGTNITVPAGVSQTVSVAITPALHRYWRIYYLSGNTLGNAWIGELSFAESYLPWNLGYSMAAALTRSINLPSAAPALGYSMSAPTLSRVKPLTAAMAEGLSMSAPALTITHMLTVPMAYGFSDALTLTHVGSGTPQIPTAVETSFTYTGQTPAAAESHLYDSNDTTDSADPTGLQTTTHASYDLGSAKTVLSVRVVNSPRFTGSGAIVYKIQYSDSGINGPWTDAGVTVTMPATLGAVVTATVSSGSHRWWKLVYSSGTLTQNAWLGELQFRA